MICLNIKHSLKHQHAPRLDMDNDSESRSTNRRWGTSTGINNNNCYAYAVGEMPPSRHRRVLFVLVYGWVDCICCYFSLVVATSSNSSSHASLLVSDVDLVGSGRDDLGWKI